MEGAWIYAGCRNSKPSHFISPTARPKDTLSISSHLPDALSGNGAQGRRRSLRSMVAFPAAEPAGCDLLDESSPPVVVDDNVSESCNVVLESSGSATGTEPDVCLPPDESCLPLGVVEDQVFKSYEDSSVVSKNSSLDISCARAACSLL